MSAKMSDYTRARVAIALVRSSSYASMPTMGFIMAQLVIAGSWAIWLAMLITIVLLTVSVCAIFIDDAFQGYDVERAVDLNQRRQEEVAARAKAEKEAKRVSSK